MTISPEVKVIVQGQPERLKLMVSSGAASATAALKLPGPLSFVFVTVIVAACGVTVVNIITSNASAGRSVEVADFIVLSSCTGAS
jgi:hypothetical protein